MFFFFCKKHRLLLLPKPPCPHFQAICSQNQTRKLIPISTELYNQFALIIWMCFLTLTERKLNWLFSIYNWPTRILNMRIKYFNTIALHKSIPLKMINRLGKPSTNSKYQHFLFQNYLRSVNWINVGLKQYTFFVEYWVMGGYEYCLCFFLKILKMHKRGKPTDEAQH